MNDAKGVSTICLGGPKHGTSVIAGPEYMKFAVRGDEGSFHVETYVLKRVWVENARGHIREYAYYDHSETNTPADQVPLAWIESRLVTGIL